MKTISTNILSLAALLVLVAALNGCALGGKLGPTLEQPQTGQTQPAAPTATLSSPSARVTATMVRPTTAPTAKVVSPTPSTDMQGADLLKMISTLDVANQAGDSLDNLP